MYEANIKKQHFDVYEERLQQIKPTLDRARSIIGSNNRTVLNNIYVTGGCAAWLIGRTDTYDDITIYLLGRQLTDQSYIKMLKEYMQCKDDLIVHKIIDSFLPSIKGFNTSVQNINLMEYTYKGTPSLRFVFMSLELDGVDKWLSNFAAMSVFINLYDLREIRTAECLCNYESNCIVTQNGCVKHGRVEYPLLFDPTESNTFSVNVMWNPVNYLWMKDYRRVIDDSVMDNNIVCSKSSFIYPTRLFIDYERYKNRILSFCEYSCCKCKDRDKVTKKYADIWWHKTYAPGGYGCRAAAQRFKKIDTGLFKQNCTCTSLIQLAKC